MWSILNLFKTTTSNFIEVGPSLENVDGINLAKQINRKLDEGVAPVIRITKSTLKGVTNVQYFHLLNQRRSIYKNETVNAFIFGNLSIPGQMAFLEVSSLDKTVQYYEADRTKG